MGPNDEQWDQKEWKLTCYLFGCFEKKINEGKVFRQDEGKNNNWRGSTRESAKPPVIIFSFILPENLSLINFLLKTTK